MDKSEKLKKLLAAIPEFSPSQLILIEKLVSTFRMSKTSWRLPASDLISNSVLDDFGDVLQMHHCFSREPFSKDKFEHALESVLKANNVDAALAPRGQRGYDIRIKRDNFSLKTEAAQAIKPMTIHISKFMELGGGKWGADPDDLKGLLAQYLASLQRIERVLILRALAKGTPEYSYELVEIPKLLLQKAARGRLEMMLNSKQSIKPGYCYVEEAGVSLFSLYFDGGGERKLQVKGLRKDMCTIHATWRFGTPMDM